jgi:hypothetical protein
MKYEYNEEEELDEEIERLVKEKRRVQNKRNH